MLPLDRSPTAPGVMLREEFLVPLALSARELAERSGLSVETVNGLLAERVKVDADIASALERALRMPAHFWLSLQAQVDAWKQLDATGDRFQGED